MPSWQPALTMLACPACRETLAIREDVVPPAVGCTGCRRLYPIVDGIPVLIVERAFRETA